MNTAVKILSTNIVDFPEEIDERSGIRIYGETSYENQMAVLSHFLHCEDKDVKEKAEIVACVREFLSRKDFRQGASEELTDEKTYHKGSHEKVYQY